MKISAYVVTLNEEDRLDRTLKALNQAVDEVVVVDSGSTDRTEEIARANGAKFIFNRWKSYCDQKHFAEQQCSNDWVLLVDADEVLNEKLIEEIQKIKTIPPKANAYNIKIRNILPNQEKPYLPWADFSVVRLYNKSVVSMPADQGNHDRVFIPKGEKVKTLKGYMKHYSFLNLEQTTAKYNLHSTEMQKKLNQKGVKYSTPRLITEFSRQFFINYFKKGLVFGGKEGFIYAVCCAYFRFLKVAKNIENQGKNANK